MSYHINDPLATTVGIADVSGEIAALESDAFGTFSGERPDAGRYTGKPYDDDMGMFIFPFRNYRAEEGRWLTSDPSGFPDGVNSSHYHPTPFLQVDPLGLVARVTQSSFTANGSAGGLSFTNINRNGVAQVGTAIADSTGVVDFNLASGSANWGWVVQRVDFNYSYRTSATATATNWSISYWEAWGVSILPGGGVEMVAGGRDTFQTQNFAGTYSGSATITGTAYFVAASSVASNNPDSWGATVAQAGGLSSILATSAPSWLPSTGGITHSLALHWE